MRGEGDVVVIEYGDYECPYCAQADLMVGGFRLTRVFRHFPVVSKHPRARDPGLRRRGGRPPGQVLGDARLALRRPGPPGHPAPLGARRALRPGHGPLRGRPPLRRGGAAGGRRLPHRDPGRRGHHARRCSSTATASAACRAPSCWPGSSAPRPDRLARVAVLRRTETRSGSLTQSSGLELAAAIRSGLTSSREVVDAHIALAEKVNPRVNAIVADRYDAAREEARGRRRPRGQRWGGGGAPAVPRRAVHRQGELRASPACRTAPGSSACSDRRAAEDATVVARVRAAGRNPARRDQHLPADHVDRVAQPRLRAHAECLRPAPDCRGLLGRGGRCGGVRDGAVRAGLRHRRIDPAPGVLQRRLRAQALGRASCPRRAISRRRTATAS